MTKAEPEGFKEFWEQIWRPHARHTDGRGLARDTFAKHVKAGAEAQDIIDGARYFFRSMKEKDREFVPLSSTWLNRMSYEDLAMQERAYQLRHGAGNSNVSQSSEREAYIAAELRRAERSFR
jgi:hypothetical protein